MRILVVRGAGPDFFSADAAGRDPDASDLKSESDQSILSTLHRNDLVSVAMLHGRATGVGLAVALACDLRIVADDAQLAFVADTGRRRLDVEALGCLRQLVGPAAALDLALTGRTFGGAEAHRLGLATRCVPPGDLDPAVDAWVAGLLVMPHAAATEVKAMVSASGLSASAGQNGASRWAEDLAASLELAATQP